MNATLTETVLLERIQRAGSAIAPCKHITPARRAELFVAYLVGSLDLDFPDVARAFADASGFRIYEKAGD